MGVSSPPTVWWIVVQAQNHRLWPRASFRSTAEPDDSHAPYASEAFPHNPLSTLPPGPDRFTLGRVGEDGGRARFGIMLNEPVVGLGIPSVDLGSLFQRSCGLPQNCSVEPCQPQACRRLDVHSFGIILQERHCSGPST